MPTARTSPRRRWPFARAPGPPRLHRLGADVPLPHAPFVALVPGAQAPLIPVELPQGLRDPAREAVAHRQLRDRLGPETGTPEMHPARLAGRESDWRALLMVDPAAAAAWRTEIAPAGAACTAILPDYLALPAAEGLWVIETEADGPVRARLGPHDGFSAEPALAAEMLRRAGDADGAAPAAILWQGPDLPQLRAALPDPATVPLVSEPGALPEGMPAPERFAHGELDLDLSADLGARAAALHARLAALRLPAALAVAGVAAWAVAVEIDARQAEADAAALRAGIHEDVRADFVPEGPITDVRAQVTRALDTRRAAAEPGPAAARPLDDLHDAAAILEGTEARLAAAALQPGGAIQLDLTVADFAALDAVAEALRAGGLEAGIGESSAAGNGVTGRILLERGG